MLHRITLALLLALLSSCASAPALHGSDLNDKIHHNYIVVNSINHPAALSERTKAQAVGKFVVASVVSSVATSGNINTKPGDIQALRNAANANMQIGMELNKQLTQALPDSYKVSAGTGADLAIAKKISDYFANKGKPDAYLDPKVLHINVVSQTWELAFISFLTSQNYALNYSFLVNLGEDIDGKEKIISSTSCAGKSEKEIPLDSWKNNNYSDVDIEAEKIVEKCYQEIISVLG